VSGLVALAVDDEVPALDELAYLLRRCPLVTRSEAVGNADDALRRLRQDHFDVVIADIRMPGLDGLELASILSRFASPPAVVFVTAHETHALDAFEVGAAGYLLKPLDADRLTGVLARIGPPRSGRDENAGAAGAAGLEPDDYETLAAEVPGRTTIVARAEVEWVESAGDYVRLHTAAGPGGSGAHGHLVRIPISLLEHRWEPHGFARIHRSYLVSLAAVRELRTEGTLTVARVGEQDLPVSRRHVRELRDRLVRHAGRSRR
jgi:two-component system response regulator LytT